MQQHGKDIPAKSVCPKRVGGAGRLTCRSEVHIRRIPRGQEICQQAEGSQ